MAWTIYDQYNLSLGNLKGTIIYFLGDGSTQYVGTGLSNVLFATNIGQTADPSLRLVLNSNNGTAGTLAGAVYASTVWTNNVRYRLLAIGIP